MSLIEILAEENLWRLMPSCCITPVGFHGSVFVVFKVYVMQLIPVYEIVIKIVDSML
jgi:hypothetical protein